MYTCTHIKHLHACINSRDISPQAPVLDKVILASFFRFLRKIVAFSLFCVKFKNVILTLIFVRYEQ